MKVNSMNTRGSLKFTSCVDHIASYNKLFFYESALTVWTLTVLSKPEALFLAHLHSSPDLAACSPILCMTEALHENLQPGNK